MQAKRAGSFGSAVEQGIIVCTLSVEFIYLVARLARLAHLARQWKNFYGVKC